MKSDQLNCREMIERLSEYIDDELGAELSECFDEHVLDCEPCRKLFATLQKTVELCRESRADVPAQSLFSQEEIAAFKAAYEQAVKEDR